MYKGESGDLYKVSFRHIYKTSGFSLNAPRKHNCLKSGYWCFENFLTNPLDFIFFIISRKGYSRRRV